jgi:serine/threonine protein kinase/regulation of enolase protein 1 (concanavalin A-like superfamily)
MRPSESDPPTPPQPSTNGFGGGNNLDETGAYPPPAASQTTATDRGRQPASHKCFDVLNPLQADGDFGWLGQYRVVRLLGQGGMGLVFLAEDTLLPRPVALKVIRPDIAGAEGIAQRFMREARATAAIKHDHIVTIYQVGEQNNLPFLAMEYLTGISLDEWLERGHIPSVELVLRLGREVASGLSAAHRHGLVHRDIKPANIWLEAPSGRVKILDFGMARSLREDVELTHSGTVMGTPAYMAPEQARGEPIGAAADLFSLGCVMYRLCTGRLPFAGESVMAVLTALSTESPPRPAAWRPELPQGLDDLVMRLLAKQPEDRPQSAEVVVKEIRTIERALRAAQHQYELDAGAPPSQIDSDKGIQAPQHEQPSPSCSPVTSRVRRNAVKFAAIAFAVLVVAAGVGFIFVAPREVTPGNLAAERSPAPAHDQREAFSIKTTSSTSERRAQSQGSKEQRSPRSGGGQVPAMNSVTRPVARTMIAADSSGVPSAAGPGVVGPPPPQSGPRKSRRVSNGQAREEKSRHQPLPDAPTGKTRTFAEQAHAAPAKKYWTDIVDPDGDCRVELDEREYRVRIIVPGKTHILSAEIARMNAPRVLRDISGDFVVTARVSGTEHPKGKATTTLYPPYYGAGILLWQDPENYVRLEIATDLRHGKARPYVNFEYRKDGAMAYSQGIANDDSWSHVRLRRRGDEILASFGPDGVRWTALAPLKVKLKDPLEVGVLAINSSARPLTAVLEGFELRDESEGRP